MRVDDADHKGYTTSEAQPEAAPTDDHLAQLFSIMSHSQRGRMDEQSCYMDDTYDSPSGTPSAERRAEECEWRGPFTLVPGPKGFKMDKKHFTIPQVVLTPESPNPHRRAISRPASPTEEYDEGDLAGAGVPHSVTFPAGVADRDRVAPQQVKPEPSPEEEERLFSMVSNFQRGRMDEQRCALQRPNRSSPGPVRAPAPAPADPNANRPAPNSDEFFQMVANSQSRRLDDQRVYLRSMPGISPPSCCSQRNGKAVTPAEADPAKCPGKGDEHGVAAGMMMMLGAQSRRAHSRPASPTLGRPEDCNPPKRSSSFNAFSKDQNVNLSAQDGEMAVADQEKFVSIMKHSQRGRMDDQSCSMQFINRRSADTNKDDPEHIIDLMAKSQSRRLDDQRATMPISPKVGKKDSSPSPSTSHSCLGSRSPVPLRRAHSRPTTPTPPDASGARAAPRSATYCPMSDHDKMQDLANQTTQMQQMQERQCALPEVFLTLGPPGESVRVPLSPMPSPRLSRPASLLLNISPSITPSPSPSPSHSPHAAGMSPYWVSPRGSPMATEEDYHLSMQRLAAAQGQKGKEKGKSGAKGNGKKEAKEAKKKR
ncbi:uncharacterized protein LOC134464230 [Engraulis encrasicolus]|uniref:uncharacterized protein LOC134464230 n=1 Tax=Engraulis encrasicolus TaxID=184585 RepID=UPI002FCEC7EC